MHEHCLPAYKNAAVEDAGGDPSGWTTPQWTATRSELLMDRLGVRTAILSVTAPGACILKGAASFTLARQVNEYAAELRDRNPQRFGFFASLPSLLDTDAALSEITYALDTLHADGVTLFTRYGDSNVYLGHPSLEMDPDLPIVHLRLSINIPIPRLKSIIAIRYAISKICS